MAPSLPLRCRCGAVTGLLHAPTPRNGNHIYCYCDDCRAFARFCGVDGLLDGSGGTEIYQTTPRQVEITQGSEHLRCMRLSPKGLIRWYTECCHTPVANTLPSAGFPFAGLIGAFIGGAALERDTFLGPVLMRGFSTFATGPVAERAHPKVPPAFILRTIGIFLPAKLRGKEQPSPFFAKGAREPRVHPRVLTKDERARLTI
jgi:hypothetical protein